MNLLSLKWNNFEPNVSKSFSSLREENEFYDVTLVSDDETEIKAHKLVLSTCSLLFKNILRGKSHPSPMLYLCGVNSEELHLVLDYIYNGEVQVEDIKLERFLFVAKILKLEGLLECEGLNVEETIDKIPLTLSPSKPNEDEEISQQTGCRRRYESKSLYISSTESEFPNILNEYETANKSLQVIESDINEVEEKIAERRERLEDGSYRCQTCGRLMKTRQDIGRHIETHLEGLSFQCSLCEKTFRYYKNNQNPKKMKYF